MLGSIVAGIISGIISSGFVYFVLFRIKPKIAIAPSICRDCKDGLCRIKIVNLTPAYLVDVKYSLYYFSRREDRIADIHEITPCKSILSFVQECSNLDKDHDYAVRISYDIDKESAKFPANTEFLFTFYAKHSITGSPIFIRKIYHLNDIKCGVFETGKSCQIVLDPQGETKEKCPQSEKCHAYGLHHA